jgi:hypothetical protein
MGIEAGIPIDAPADGSLPQRIVVLLLEQLHHRGLDIFVQLNLQP